MHHWRLHRNLITSSFTLEICNLGSIAQIVIAPRIVTNNGPSNNLYNCYRNFILSWDQKNHPNDEWNRNWRFSRAKDPLKVKSGCDRIQTSFLLSDNISQWPRVKPQVRDKDRSGPAGKFSNPVFPKWISRYDGRSKSQLAWILSRHNFYFYASPYKVTRVLLRRIFFALSVADGFCPRCFNNIS